MKFLIFEEYMIERVTFLQSILFFLVFSEIESKEAWQIYFELLYQFKKRARRSHYLYKIV